jgi:hypothetical protein
MKTITKTISTICCSAILAVSTFATELPTVKPQQIASLSSIKYVSFSPDSSKIFTIGYGKLRMGNILSNNIDICSKSADYGRGAFSPNGEYIAVVNYDNDRVDVLDLNCTLVDSYEPSQGFIGDHLNWLSDSNNIIFFYGTSSDHSNKIYKTNLDKSVSSYNTITKFYSLSGASTSLSPDDELIAWTDSYGYLYIFTVETLNSHFYLSDEITDHEMVEFIDNRTIVHKHSPSTNSKLDTITIRDIDTGILDSFTSFDNSSTNLNIRYIKNSSYILVNIVDTNQYQLYDMRSKSYVAKVDFGDINAGGSYDMEVSQDGSKLAIKDSSNNLKVFDISAISSAENFKVAPVVSNINSTLKNRDTLNITFDVASE